MYQVSIENCNNIVNGVINITPGRLNIKYGINGTGKSTVAKAVKLAGQPELQTMKSFFSEAAAKVTVTPPCSNVLVFDEDFVNQVVFKDDEVIEHSFEVFLKTPNYDERKARVDALLLELHELFAQDEEIAKLRQLVIEINSKFKRSKSGTLTKTGFMKSLLSKQNIYNIPSELSSYEPFITNQDINISWIDWRNKGDDYDIGDRCPYCSEPINRPEQDTRKSVFQRTYKKTDSQNLKEALSLLQSLEEFLIPEKYNVLVDYIKNDTSEDVILAIMQKLTTEFDLIQQRFSLIDSFGRSDIASKDISGIEEDIEQMQFPVDLFEYFGGDRVSSIFDRVNSKIELIKQHIAQIKREMGALKGLMQATIQNSQSDINDFLKTAGIHYSLRLEAEDENHSRAILEQCFSDEKTDVTQIRSHLSWGEKNAFALILFMYYAVAKNPDLIILDDPISSFDSNKKFAIMHRMFKNIGSKRDVSFVGRTVLMLTHDFEPITDFLVVGRMGAESINATFVWNESHCLREKEISASRDVKLIYTECEEIARNTSVNIVSRIVFVRKLCYLHECRDKWGDAYEILSSLIHGSGMRRKISNDNYVALSQQEVHDGLECIREFIPDFDYSALSDTTYTISGISSLYKQEANAYLRIQLFRELTELDSGRSIKIRPMDEAWFKYIDETYHIENDYLHYLDLLSFNITPDYIIEMVDGIVDKLEGESA